MKLKENRAYAQLPLTTNKKIFLNRPEARLICLKKKIKNCILTMYDFKSC